MRSGRAGVGWTSLLLASLLLPRPGQTEEGARIEAVVGATVRANYESLHGCYRKQLAVDRSRGGSLILRLRLGQADAVGAVKLERDQLASKEVASCVVGWVRGWTLRGAAAAGAGPGTELLLPLTFQPVPDQLAVRRDDLAEIPLQGSSARLLLTRQNAGAELASLSLLEVRQPLRLPAQSGVEQALYVLEGSGELELSAPRLRRWSLRQGDAAWLSPGAQASLRGSSTLLQVFAPAGLEQAYLQDGPLPSGGAGAGAVVADGRRAGGRRTAPGAPVPRPLLHPGNVRRGRIYLGLLEAGSGSTMAAHAHLGRAEIVFLLSGSGELRVDQTVHRLEPGHGVYLKPNLQHAVKLDRVRAVQIYVMDSPDRAEGPR